MNTKYLVFVIKFIAYNHYLGDKNWKEKKIRVKFLKLDNSYLKIHIL